MDKTISIFYNDWSLNPYYDDDYSERVTITITKLKDIKPEEFKAYTVMWWDQSIYVSNFVEICVRNFNMKTLEFTSSELSTFKKLLKWGIETSWDNYYASIDEEDKEGFKRLATKYEKMYNKFFEPSPKLQK